jgi:hypothetical protein
VRLVILCWDDPHEYCSWGKGPPGTGLTSLLSHGSRHDSATPPGGLTFCRCHCCFEANCTATWCWCSLPPSMLALLSESVGLSCDSFCLAVGAAWVNLTHTTQSW